MTRSVSEDELAVRVFLRPLGTPIPLRLAGLSIASFVVGGLNLGWVPVREATQIGLVLVAIPTVLQLLILAPSWANLRAVARPTPPEAPVITTTPPFFAMLSPFAVCTAARCLPCALPVLGLAHACLTGSIAELRPLGARATRSL